MPFNTRARARRLVVVALAVLSLVGVAACGSDDSNSGSSSSKKLTISMLPLAGLAPYYYAQSQGYFKDEGITVSSVDIKSPPDGIANLQSGRAQLAFINNGTLAAALVQGVDLRAVAPLYFFNPAPQGDQGFYVKKGSSITSPKDLVGKKVGLVSLNGNVQAMVDKLVADDGGDPSKVNYTLVATPDMAAATRNGTIDVGQLVEPFVTLNKNDLSPVIPNFTLTLTNQPVIVGYMVTTSKFADSNPKAVAAFKAGFDKAAAKLAANDDLARKTIGAFTGTDPTALSTLALPNWSDSLAKDSTEEQIALMKQFGLISKEPDMAKFFGN